LQRLPKGASDNFQLRQPTNRENIGKDTIFREWYAASETKVMEKAKPSRRARRREMCDV
jgi:hypothetical protein